VHIDGPLRYCQAQASAIVVRSARGCKFDCFSGRFPPSLQLARGFVDVTDSIQALLRRKRSGDLKSKIALREHVASG
jgi:hypothetical protein